MSRRLWVLAFFLLIHLPSSFTRCASASPPSPSPRRALATATAPASMIADCQNSSSAGAAGSCVSDSSTIAGPDWSSMTPRSKTLKIIVVVIFVACIAMGFFSVCARRYCLREADMVEVSYEGVKSSQYMQELVTSLPVVRYESAAMAEAEGKARRECAVCLSEFEVGEELRLLPACAHLFHKTCIDMWLFSHTTCPLCRVSLPTGAQKRLCSSTNATPPRGTSSAVDVEPTLTSSVAT